MIVTLIKKIPLLKPMHKEQYFMVSILIVHMGNYLYNLILGRMLGPEEFSDAVILVTFLLIFSFAGMAFQIVAAKFTVIFTGLKLNSFVKSVFISACIVGVLFGVLISGTHKLLQELFQTQNAEMFLIFGIGLPLYFIMSVNRGVYQGKFLLKKLALTYHFEMLFRIIFTVVMLFFLPFMSSSIAVSIGIILSFVCGLYPFQKFIFKSCSAPLLKLVESKEVLLFLGLTLFYEISQIIINNSDIILVKYFFSSEEAGLYASLAIIGRVVYFVAWMFVMLLLPKVIKLKKEGKATGALLFKYVGYIVMVAVVIIFGTAIFHEIIVQMMFGEAYVSVSSLLWLYSLAASIFAIANIFAYYFLSIGQYLPVMISVALGATQILLIFMYHNSLKQVIVVQILAMLLLLLFQLVYFIYHQKR